MLIKSIRLTYAVAFAICFAICDAKGQKHCPPVSCGDLHNIAYPFRLNGSSSDQNCLNHPAVLSCQHNNTILNLFNGTYYVRKINYEDHTIHVLDPGLLSNTCPPLPLQPLATSNFSAVDRYQAYGYGPNDSLAFVDCQFPNESTDFVNYHCTNTSSATSYSYIVKGAFGYGESDWCNPVTTILALFEEIGNFTSSSIHDELQRGFKLSWERFLLCGSPYQSFHCFLESLKPGFIAAAKITGWNLIARLLLGIIVLLGFCGRKLYWRKFLKEDDDAVEEFLDAYKNLMPRRYSYSDIKKMTRNLKDKLGQGGFGSVFKGLLQDGHLVAVKMLSGTKGKGQDFISEVATIGRIHHVNVVQLIGFCSEGSKRALVYDFMPNGSLDKYIFSEKEKNVILSWDVMHEIALGVARAIEYLHQGCDMQILHFDIKPHNILLDENFAAKISDFGLARFYPRDNNTVSLTAVRGTFGYMAPELFHRSIGGVSKKADAYSFGMLLLEMAGRRKNTNAHAQNSSQIYFPSWIYEQLQKGLSIEIENACESDKKVTKRMLMVALWCIQLKPADRPCMSKAVEMLEGEVEALQMPPKPFFCPQQMPMEDPSDETDVDEESSLLHHSATGTAASIPEIIILGRTRNYS
ncbi:unnamed protein product [Malus baccata var. baccata]